MQRIVLEQIGAVLKDTGVYHSLGESWAVSGHPPLISSLIATLINVDSNNRTSSLNFFYNVKL